MSDQKKLETKLIVDGEPKERFADSVSIPIFQSSTYAYREMTNYHDFKYLRLNNSPNHHALHEKIASIESTEASLVSSSGMASITSSLLSFLNKGDHLLAQSCLYGGTQSFILEEFPKFGIEYDFFDWNDLDSLEKKIKPNTKVLYIEGLTNPLLQVIDVEKAVEFAKKHNLVSMIDNTFASPVNFRPAEWGVDLVIHSCTKYMNGHSDIVAGCVSGSREYIERIRHCLNHYGGTLDPHACFLLHRGLKTLYPRMKMHNENGMKVAQFLDKHPKVERVLYAGLESHAGHQVAKKLYSGFSGMLSFDLKAGSEAAKNLTDRLNYFIHAPSLGGVESLVTVPWLTTHVGIPEDERKRAGISPGLVRLSVGLENPEDLIGDLEQALSG